MTLVFVSLGGETYLQDIREKNSYRTPPEHHVNISLDEPQLLALQVDHLGIRNIAFGLDKDGKPKWLRDENRLAKIFVDRVSTSFTRIHIVYNPIKIRMIDIEQRDSHHPRPLLPYDLGRWNPYSIKTVREPYLPIEGYFEPSYIELSTYKPVYLSYTYKGGISGIFNESGEGREQVLLGKAIRSRTVNLLGLYRRTIPEGEIAFFQIETDNGSFLPLIPHADYEILDEKKERNEFPSKPRVWAISLVENCLGHNCGGSIGRQPVLQQTNYHDNLPTSAGRCIVDTDEIDVPMAFGQFVVDVVGTLLGAAICD
ncbi:hypothetical protein GQ43DRAFT_476689 [Delitschia confertaspora ATCC 74209]|uniref:Uncharacterized protein n=1 Tax=Delitschia confertaspora ATCC 74209 TaxID=1513339 RepID=A0A9P4JB45_9PLEO|nr:hypothetical protein GQ43DRAFT_476689 [Delitschia confertaspora ATCC 74209]